MDVYAVYYDPSDYPGQYVVRIFEDGIPHPAPFTVGDSLEYVRSQIPVGLVCFDRHPLDEPQIVETWL